MEETSGTPYCSSTLEYCCYILHEHLHVNPSFALLGNNHMLRRTRIVVAAAVFCGTAATAFYVMGIKSPLFVKCGKSSANLTRNEKKATPTTSVVSKSSDCLRGLRHRRVATIDPVRCGVRLG